MKSIIWEGSSLKVVKSFPADIKKRVGFELYNVQLGLEPSDWKPITNIGIGVKEIRIHSENEYRVVYVAVFGNFIHVLHAFVKKTQKTSKKDIELARKRLGSIEIVR